MKKTVIGSFWREPSLDEQALREAIKTIVDLQLRYGLDIVSDGELRYDMVGYFHQIPGLELTQEGFGISGKITPMDNLDQFYKIEDYKFVRNYLDEIGNDTIEIKSAITGPNTLGFLYAREGRKYYRSVIDQQIYRDLAHALRPLVNALYSIGSYVQIDEPMLSAQFFDPIQAIETINYMLADFSSNERLSVHVCGKLNQKLIDSMLKTNVETLSLDFSGDMESNISFLRRDKIEEHGKKIGVGCISIEPKVDDVDRVDVVLNRLIDIELIIGFENMRYIHPACGMYDIPKEAAEKILKTMKEVGDRYSKLT
ncbi:MAG: hypothetical protein GTN80_01065 [Nitrososphaeria archaeon]|nr:hypothetical protein [Nitrososphaeria archaeon]NIQ32236.1 hypothetical protein [Nitrososphaeria archaeon]